MREHKDRLGVAIASARRNIALFWPVVGPTEEVQYADGHYLSQLIIRYSLSPLHISFMRKKVWVPSQHVLDLILKQREGLPEFDDEVS